MAEYWYNTTYHSALGRTPFEVLYGNTPRHFGIVPADASSVTDIQEWLNERSAMTQAIKQHLVRAQQRMKAQADKHRLEREFNVGDWVYLKLQPYIQQSVHHRSNHKLNFKYFGPYLILQKVGMVAYKLQLPPTSKIHPVIHVSQLKKALPPETVVSTDEQLQCLTMDITVETPQVCDVTLKKVGNSVIPHALVQWKNCPSHWAVWENMSLLQNRHSA